MGLVVFQLKFIYKNNKWIKFDPWAMVVNTRFKQFIFSALFMWITSLHGLILYCIYINVCVCISIHVIHIYKIHIHTHTYIFNIMQNMLTHAITVEMSVLIPHTFYLVSSMELTRSFDDPFLSAWWYSHGHIVMITTLYCP